MGSKDILTADSNPALTHHLAAVLLRSLKIILIVLGCALVGISLFSYESEQRNVQDKIELWWIKLDDFRFGALAAEFNIVSRFSAAVSQIMDIGLGERLISIQSFLASNSISFLGACLVMLYADIKHWGDDNVRGHIEMFVLIGIAALFACLSLIGAKRRARLTFAIWLLVMGVVALLVWAQPINGQRSLLRVFIMFLALALSFALDLLLIAGFRHLLRMAVRFSVWVALLTNIAALALVAGAQALTTVIVGFGQHSFVGVLGTWLVYLNGSDLIILVLLFCAAGVLVLHHALWPLIQRPLYAVQRTAFFSNRSVARSAGIALIVTGSALGNGKFSIVELIKRFLGS